MKEFIKKICICGDSSVGKTSLIRRFVFNKYNEKYITTLGTVISKKIVKFPDKKYRVNLQIWDISGQAEFKRMQVSAFRHSEGAIAVCDIMHPETASNLQEWIMNLRSYTNEKIPIIILANKYDLAGSNLGSMMMINRMLEHLNCPILTTSAKTGYNVEFGFKNIAAAITSQTATFPTTALDMVAMPEIFENPYAFLDYVLFRFSKSVGDDEMSMHMIRSKVECCGENFNRMPKEEAMEMVNHLIQIITNYKGKEEAMQLRMEFMEAYNRCNW